LNSPENPRVRYIRILVTENWSGRRFSSYIGDRKFLVIIVDENNPLF